MTARRLFVTNLGVDIMCILQGQSWWKHAGCSQPA